MTICLAHGGGGAETAALIADVFMRHFRNEHNARLRDAVVLPAAEEVAFTTDSYVVRPLFFPGGDIGRLAVCGTVNDLLTSGAEPRYLSAGFVLEEGLAIDDLRAICASMAAAAAEAGVHIVTGDTKVVEGRGGVIINTSGIGVMRGRRHSFSDARAGDAVLVTGTLGDHHACIAGARMNIATGVASDVAPLGGVVDALHAAGIAIHGMRDITRGGLATILCEIAEAAGLAPLIEESALPVRPEVAGLARILGLDPLYMGNEGNAVLVVPGESRAEAVARVRKTRYGENCADIGSLAEGGRATLISRLGGRRLLTPLRGEGLPRIC